MHAENHSRYDTQGLLAEKERASFFPDTLPSTHLKNVKWIGEDILFLEWDGLKAGDNTEAHYYKLTLLAAKTGVNTGKGFYLQEELSFYFKVES
ncbi:MAG: hypothetical protein LBH85_08305 [Treponema sp.]|jgi:hypothetical protein|nr:hypothetical protein [Treponema sp.]